MEERNQNVSPDMSNVYQENGVSQSQQTIQFTLPVPQQPESSGAQQVEYAGFWVRFGAVLIDGLVVIVLSMIFGKVLSAALSGSILQDFLELFLLTWMYAIYMLHRYQATLGKMAVGLKVMRVDGSKPEVSTLFMREIVGKFLSWILMGIGYLMIVFTDKKQGLHDKISDTVVIYDPARKRRPWVVFVIVIFTALIPFFVIMASIFLVEIDDARRAAQRAGVVASGKSMLIGIVICESDGGNVNAYRPNTPICDVSESGNGMWQDVSSFGYEVRASAARNADIGTYSFTLSKKGHLVDIVCNVAENTCE